MASGLQEKTTQTLAAGDALTLHLPPSLKLSADVLLELASLNSDLRLEYRQGDLIIMPPTGGDTGDRNAEITMQLRLWAKGDGSGKAFDSSTAFRFPSGDILSPDASWVRLTDWQALNDEERSKFPPLCPEFVIELRSPSDTLTALRKKMHLYMLNGVKLAWLLDPDTRQAHVYTEEGIEKLENPDTLSGEPLLTGFVLDLKEVW